MKKLLFIVWLLIMATTHSYSQNYITGTVSLHGNNTASGTTTIAPGASLAFHNYTFFEQADFINQGDSTAISADSGTLVLNGATGQNITGRFKISALQLNNGNGVSINSSVPLLTMVTILDSVFFGNISNAAFNAGDGLMTLRSSALKTARIADLTHSNTNEGNTINGKVIVERYLQNKRAWRLLAPPTTGDSAGGQTIKEAWQESATATRGQIVNPNPGYGTVITRPGKNPAAATGYDDGVQYAGGYSLRMYTSNGLLTQPINTDATRFSPHAAYLVEVRGDRSVMPEPQNVVNPTPSTATVLRSKGVLHNGDVINTITNGSGSFAGVANPYACAIDFSRVALSGVTNGFYVWDPNINTLGAWVYIDGDDGFVSTPEVPDAIGSYTNTATNSLIQSGQAILVKTIGSSGTITFKENNKQIASRADVFREYPLPAIKINLYSNDGNKDIFLDGTASVFDASFSKKPVAGEDVYKPGNTNENLSFYTSGSFLMKEKWPLPLPGDTLAMRLWNTSAKKYRFVMATRFFPASPKPYLWDNYLQTSVAINAGADTEYNFEINSDEASKAASRFAVIFQSAVLPVSFTQIKAKAENGGVNVEWHVQNETNVVSYEIARATDNSTFIKIGSVAAGGANSLIKSYNFFDSDPESGDNFYRVKSIDINGNVQYTNVVKATVANGIMKIVLLSNPVTNNTIRLSFINAPDAAYKLSLYGNDGKKILEKSIAHTGRNAVYKLPAGNLAKGLYVLQIANETSHKQVAGLRLAVE